MIIYVQESDHASPYYSASEDMKPRAYFPRNYPIRTGKYRVSFKVAKKVGKNTFKFKRLLGGMVEVSYDDGWAELMCYEYWLKHTKINMVKDDVVFLNVYFKEI